MSINGKYFKPDVWLEKPRIVCGIMSGTSLDGIDTALVRFWQENGKLHFEQNAFETYPFSPELRQILYKILNDEIRISEVSRVNVQLAHEYVNAVKSLSKASNIHLNDIELIGVHGQTVWHEPNNQFPTTLQLFNPSVMTTALNIPVVSDFRSADVALGGQGAPLVPVFDREFLFDNTRDVIALNIGGMSNITFLPKDKNQNIIAFDTGPGNVLIDMAASKYFNSEYDEGGLLASKGNYNEELLNELMSLEYISKAPPKSTGRELYNSGFLNQILNQERFKNLTNYDLINTLTKFTAQSIAHNIKEFCNENSKIVVSGGGVKNKELMNMLKTELEKAEIIASDELNINSDAKEAICFGFLAYLNIAQIPGNISSVTGASQETVLGSLTFPYSE